MTKKQHGFTIVELTIAIAFLSVLMIAILLLTLTAGKLYVKGDTNKSINQAGRDFSDTIRRDFLSAGVSTITPMTLINGGSATSPSQSGRICLGAVSYLWNTADLINETAASAQSARITLGDARTSVRFIRITNPKSDYCAKDNNGRYPVNVPSTESATELFGGTGREYALYSMVFTKLAEDGEKGLYQIKYTLGTNEQGTSEREANGGYVRCKPNTDVTANFDYCSVSDFDMVVRVGGVR